MVKAALRATCRTVSAVETATMKVLSARGCHHDPPVPSSCSARNELRDTAILGDGRGQARPIVRNSAVRIAACVAPAHATVSHPRSTRERRRGLLPPCDTTLMVTSRRAASGSGASCTRTNRLDLLDRTTRFALRLPRTPPGRPANHAETPQTRSAPASRAHSHRPPLPASQTFPNRTAGGHKAIGRT